MTKHPIYTLWGLLLALCNWPALSIASDDDLPIPHDIIDTMIFTCALPSSHPAFAVAAEMYSKAFADIGYRFQMLSRPMRRAITSANNGKVDGECARSRYIEQDDVGQRLVRVDAEVIEIVNRLWTLNPSLSGLTRDDIINGPYLVGYLNGNISADNLLIDREGDTTFKLNSIKNGLAMLAAKRIDILIAPKLQIQYAAQQAAGQQAPHSAGVFNRYPVYPYLFSRHKHLAPKLARALQKLLDDPDHPVHQFSH